jgi:hypothetical protein
MAANRVEVGVKLKILHKNSLKTLQETCAKFEIAGVCVCVCVSLTAQRGNLRSPISKGCLEQTARLLKLGK